MKILFADQYKYLKFVDGMYVFEDKHGDLFLTKETKFVNKEEDTVLFFKRSKSSERIEYSYSTARKLGRNLQYM